MFQEPQKMAAGHSHSGIFDKIQIRTYNFFLTLSMTGLYKVIASKLLQLASEPNSPIFLTCLYRTDENFNKTHKLALY